jgi:vitamin B12 transporter
MSGFQQFGMSYARVRRATFAGSAATILFTLTTRPSLSQTPPDKTPPAVSTGAVTIELSDEDENESDETRTVAKPVSLQEEQGDVPMLDPVQVRPPELEPQPPIEQPIATSPTTSSLPARQFGGTVRVIDREQIERSNARDVADLLRNIPGVDVVRTGPTGGVTTTFLRGSNSQHTKVLLDGIPVNDPSNASRLFDFGALSLHDIERVEVLQGPQSVLYGSDAIGGVVNVITRKGEGPGRVRASVMGGSFGTHRESVGISGSSDRVHYSVNGEWRQTDGFTAASPRVGGTESDGFALGTVSGRFGWTPDQDTELQYIFRWSDARTEIDDTPFTLGSPPSDDLHRKNLSEQFFQRIELRRQSWEGTLEHVVSFSHTHIDREDTDDIFPSDFAGNSHRFLYQANVYVMPGNTLSAGVDYLDENAFSSSPFGTASASQRDTGIFLQDQIDIGNRWFTTVGWRWDNHNAAGSSSTYRLTSLVDVWETGTRIRGSIGTGFRAPSLAENLFPFGNPALRPETNKGWEYGVEQDFADGLVVVGATYFRNDFRNLILFDLNTFTLLNIGAGRAHGVELWSQSLLTDTLRMDASYTRTDTQDSATGLPLVRRPQHKGTLSFRKSFWCNQASTALRGRFIGNRLDARDGSIKLDDYVVWDLTADYYVDRDFRVFGRIDNLFDEDYEEITGFSARPLALFAGADWVF